MRVYVDGVFQYQVSLYAASGLTQFAAERMKDAEQQAAFAEAVSPEVRDFRAVKDGAEEARSAAFYNDEQAVGIDIVKSKGFSTTAVAERYKPLVAENAISQQEYTNAVAAQKAAEADVAAAKAAGLPCVAVSFGFNDLPPGQLSSIAIEATLSP